MQDYDFQAYHGGGNASRARAKKPVCFAAGAPYPLDKNGARNYIILIQE